MRRYRLLIKGNYTVAINALALWLPVIDADHATMIFTTVSETVFEIASQDDADIIHIVAWFTNDLYKVSKPYDDGSLLHYWEIP